MKKCPRCELNYINDYGELCDICKRELKIESSTSATDNNKQEVEKYLIPFLKALSPDKIELFTRKDISYEAFKLRLPLLVKCNNEYRDKEHCKKEVIVDNSTTYRYYIKPYLINGQYYHICSQWWCFGTEYSKTILQLIKEIKL